MSALWAGEGLFAALSHVQNLLPFPEPARGDPRSQESELVVEANCFIGSLSHSINDSMGE
jgi:hypothetical protein